MTFSSPQDSADPTTTDELVRRAAAAEEAFDAWSVQPPRTRARALAGAASALEARADELVGLATRETGLTEPRLRGEVRRTCVQLRLFADLVADGEYLDVRIDEADPDFVLGPRPDLRRMMVPVGPVLNFAASNFPFAFSVPGGDTASALAAGCSVVVKAHWGHPELSRLVGAIMSDALEAAGAPRGTLQVIYGQEQGVAMLKDPRIRAATFTGSLGAGRMLADVAAARPAPIPFYGELGSVNPEFVTRARLEGGGREVATGYVASVALSAGQFCTKPGFLFVSDLAAVAGTISEAAASVGEHRLLNRRIAEGYALRRDDVLAAEGVTVLARGSVRWDEDGHAWATPTLVGVSLATLEVRGSVLLDEAFGPLSIVVEYSSEADLPAVVRRLFPGNLTGGVHAREGEETPELRALLRELSRTSGRVLVNGWPTGVSVTPAMQHGGPWPATTGGMGTSVGTDAVTRFLRGVTYQNVPQALLPEPLRDDNPWGVPRRYAPAGESASWGSRAST